MVRGSLRFQCVKRHAADIQLLIVHAANIVESYFYSVTFKLYFVQRKLLPVLS